MASRPVTSWANARLGRLGLVVVGCNGGEREAMAEWYMATHLAVISLSRTQYDSDQRNKRTKA
jgi:hypothetical protein